MKRIRIQLLNDAGFAVDDLMTQDEAAEFLAVSASRVSQLIADGTLTKYTLNSRCVLVAWKQVEAYSKANRKPGPKPTIG